MIGSLVIWLGTLSAGASVGGWRADALRLNGLSARAARVARQRLEARKNLDEELRKALAGEDRFLAMDVIALLKRKSLIEDLILFSANDVTGFSYLALSNFVPPSRLAPLFRERIEQSSTPPAAQVVLLDTLSRMKLDPSPKTFEELLLKHSSPEVRSAALSFLRSRLLREKRSSDRQLLTRVLEDPGISRQRREQARALVQEIALASVGASP